MEARRAAIFAVSPQTGGLRGRVLWMARRRIGRAPGILRVFLTDLRVGLLATLLYGRVNDGARSMTQLQREMVATVVNGKIGGAP
jgi:hypothetical protein